MQAQPPRPIPAELPKTDHPAPMDSRIKRASESSSSRSSTSSWIEEPITTVNMDIMTGHLILV